jgi:cytochrome subunit of sulfide dehydrogenase
VFSSFDSTGDDMKLFLLFRCAAALLSLACMLPALAQSTSATELQVRALAATCAQCHGTDGRAVAGSTVPGLAGLPAAYASLQMKAFKSGERSATVMHQISKGYSDAQIDKLSLYFANVSAPKAGNAP